MGVFEKMEFKDLVMQRYATKKFNGKRISDDRISELLGAGAIRALCPEPSAVEDQNSYRPENKRATPPGIE